MSIPVLLPASRTADLGGLGPAAEGDGRSSSEGMRSSERLSAHGHQLATAVDERAVQPAAELCAEFNAFVAVQFPRVVRWVMVCGASLEDARDAAQEAFAAAWRELRLGRWQEVANQEGWIRRVALRQHWHTRGCNKKLQIVPVPDVPDLEQSGLTTMDLTEETLDVMKALGALEPELRAIMADEMAGYTAAETGQALGLTEQQVRDRRKKARRELAKQLGGRKNQKGEQA
jgi:RNA polymerase sigma factor (sigma-70 family)